MLKMLRRLFKPKPKRLEANEHIHIGVKSKKIAIPTLTTRVEPLEVALPQEPRHNTPIDRVCPQGDIDRYHSSGLVVNNE